MTFEALLAGLVGSLLTVIVTKLLDLFQKSKEHKYSLQRIWFENKLKVAETAFSKLYTNASLVSALSALYEKFSVPDERAKSEVFETYNKLYAERLLKVEDSLSEVSNSLFLYFDFDLETLKRTESVKRFYDILIDIQDLKIWLEVYDELRKESKEAGDIQHFEAERDKILQRILPKLRELSLLLNEFQEDVLKVLKSVRAQMKKYEA